MLLSILSSNNSFGMKIVLLLISVFTLLPALSLHEFAHGYAAYKCGDPTAKSMGRLSLNPFAHLDPMGTLMLLIAGFGWAKPVPINSSYFRKPRRDIALVSLAGPLMNFLLAAVSILLRSLAANIALYTGNISSNIVYIILFIFDSFALLNLGLGLFNLIPLPPLDGSNVLMCLLKPQAAAKYSKIRYYSRYIFLGLVLLTWLPYPINRISDIIFFPLDFLRESMYTGLLKLFNAFFSLFFK